MKIVELKLICINGNKNYKFGKTCLLKWPCHGNVKFPTQQPILPIYFQINFRKTRKVWQRLVESWKSYKRSKSARALSLLLLKTQACFAFPPGWMYSEKRSARVKCFGAFLIVKATQLLAASPAPIEAGNKWMLVLSPFWVLSWRKLARHFLFPWSH